MGDSVLGLITSEYLYKRFYEYNEGKLSKIKAKVISENPLYQIASSLNLGAFLLLGRGERETGGAERKSNLANLLEALLAAIYLDQGLDATREFILCHLKNIIDDIDKNILIKDYKTILQEFCQKKYKVLPEYRLVSEKGPDHNKQFKVTIFVNGKEYSSGTGKSKSKAEQAAARDSLCRLNVIKL